MRLYLFCPVYVMEPVFTSAPFASLFDTSMTRLVHSLTVTSTLLTNFGLELHLTCNTFLFLPINPSVLCKELNLTMAPNPLIQRLYTLNVPPEPKPNFIISAKTTRAANISRSPTMSPASSVYNPNQENEDPQDHRPLGTLGGGCIAPETLINPFLGPRTLPTAPYSREGHFRVVPLLPLGTNGDQSAAITTGLASFRLMSPYSSDPYGIAELAVECDKLDISGPDDRMMALRRVPPNYRFFPTSNPSLEGYGYSPYAGPGPLNGAPTLSNTGTPDGRGSSQRTIGKDFMEYG